MSTLYQSMRAHLVIFARRSGARITTFSRKQPTDWRPEQVRSPKGVLNSYFTDASAWEFFAAQIKDGQPIEIVNLNKPKGAKRYVMKINLEADRPQLYVKLQPGSGKIIGRSFHYSERGN